MLNKESEKQLTELGQKLQNEWDLNNKEAIRCFKNIKDSEENTEIKCKLYINFLDKIIVSQMNQVSYSKKYLNSDGKENLDKYHRHQEGLCKILFEVNDLICQMFNDKSMPKDNKNQLLNSYKTIIQKIGKNNTIPWSIISRSLKTMAKTAIESRNIEKIKAYNKIAQNFIYSNMKNKTILFEKIKNTSLVDLIDEKTFEKYTDDPIVQGLFDEFKSYYNSKHEFNFLILNRIKTRTADKNKIKFCLETMLGNKMSGGNWTSTDLELQALNNKMKELNGYSLSERKQCIDKIDFDFSTIDQDTLNANENIKSFCSGFSSLYKDLQKNNFAVYTDDCKKYNVYGKYFFYLGSWIVPFLWQETNFDEVCKILGNRLDFLCKFSNIQIEEQQKNKLIIQAFVYATNKFPKDKESAYKAFSMFTGNTKFGSKYRFTLADMRKILSNMSKNLSVAPYQILEFCKDYRSSEVRIYDILKLANEMKIQIKYFENDRGLSYDQLYFHHHNYGFKGTKNSIFHQNDLKDYIADYRDDFTEKDFDTWFSFFEAKATLSKDRSRSQNEEIQSFFIQVVNKIPDRYLTLEKFNDLTYFFTREKTENAINLTPDQFNTFILKINQQMNEDDFQEFKRMVIKYFRISGKEITEQEIKDAYEGAKNFSTTTRKNKIQFTGVNKSLNNKPEKIKNEINSNIASNKLEYTKEDLNIKSKKIVISESISIIKKEDKLENANIIAQDDKRQNIITNPPMLEIQVIENKIEKPQDNECKSVKEINCVKDRVKKASDKNWFVRKFWKIVCFILELIKNDDIQEIDNHLNKLNNKLEQIVKKNNNKAYNTSVESENPQSKTKPETEPKNFSCPPTCGEKQ